MKDELENHCKELLAQFKDVDSLCKFFVQVSDTFSVQPEFIENVTDVYNLIKPSEVYTKMCELGYRFNWKGFI